MTDPGLNTDLAVPSTDHREERRQLGAWPLRSRELAHFLMAYVALTLVGLGLGFFITQTAVAQVIRGVDNEVAVEFVEERTPALNELTYYTSEVGGTIPVIVTIIVVGVLLLILLRRWKETASLWAALSLEALVFLTVSTLVGRARPPVEHLDPSPPTGGFPSGHTGATAALYLTIATMTWWVVPRTAMRVVVGVFAAAVVVMVGASRLYRGMHFISDVTIGALLGGICALVAWVIVVRSPRTGELL